MKRIIIIDALIIALALPMAVAITKWSGATQAIWRLAGAALNPFATGILTSSLTQTIILVGPLSLFLCLTIVAIVKEKPKTSYLLALLTSASWAVIMVSTLFVRFGP